MKHFWRSFHNVIGTARENRALDVAIVNLLKSDRGKGLRNGFHSDFPGVPLNKEGGSLMKRKMTSYPSRLINVTCKI